MDCPVVNFVASLSQSHERPLLAHTVSKSLVSCSRGSLLPSLYSNCSETHDGSVVNFHEKLRGGYLQASLCSINFQIANIAALRLYCILTILHNFARIRYSNFQSSLHSVIRSSIFLGPNTALNFSTDYLQTVSLLKSMPDCSCY
jgi:hypothetical protein